MDVVDTKYVRADRDSSSYYLVGSDASVTLVRKIKSQINWRGYETVQVIEANGRKRTRTVHSLVAEAFIGPRPADAVINHKDGNKLNNLPHNLEYVTQQENCIHAYRTGLRSNRADFMRELAQKNKGRPQTHLRKFSSDQVRDMILEYRAGGISMNRLGKKYGISAPHVHHLIHNHKLYPEVER